MPHQKLHSSDENRLGLFNLKFTLDVIKIFLSRPKPRPKTLSSSPRSRLTSLSSRRLETRLSSRICHEVPPVSIIPFSIVTVTVTNDKLFSIPYNIREL